MDDTAIKIYTPKPINTDDVILPKEIEELAEKLAEQVHEIWSFSRIKDGWTYGTQRNDEKKLRLVLFLTTNYRNQKKNTTELLQFRL